MEKIFNIIFIGALASLFVARLFYGFSVRGILVNPFIFILIPYFPGLSLLGSVIGAGAYLLSLMRHKDNPLPLGRICDFFSIAFLISLPIGFLGLILFSEKSMPIIKLGIQAIAYFILFIVFLKLFLPQLINGKFKEGTIAFLFLTCFSIVELTANAFAKISILNYFKNFENIILILILILSVVALIKYDSILLKIKQIKKGK